MERDANRAAYESPGVVEYYLRDTHDLEPAERAIIDLLRPRLAGMRMLDIGVGAGRTTVHLQPLVKEYVAIDYAPAMIEACKRRFPHLEGAFRVGDARAMPEFGPGRFDLVLFSFNGLDAVSHDGRMGVLREVARVLAPGGSFVFSSHNLRTLPQLYRIRLARNPRALARSLIRAAGLRLRNGLRPAAGSHALIYDGAHLFRIKQYYVLPEEQVRQLHEAGYTDVRVFALDGQPVADERTLSRVTDSWLHYLCTSGV